MGDLSTFKSNEPTDQPLTNQECAAGNTPDKYLLVLNNMQQAFCIVEMICDNRGNPIDYYFREANRAFINRTNIGNPVDKRVLELLPDHEKEWFDIYYNVAKSGKSIRIIKEVSFIDNTFNEIFVFPAGPQGSNLVGVFFNDITIHKQLENTLRKSEARKEFLLHFGDVLRNATDPILVQEIATKLLGQYLQVSRALYFEVESGEDSDYYIVRRDYHAPGIESIVGRYRANDFGTTIFNEIRAGRTLVVNNVETDPRITAEERKPYPNIGILAYVLAPLIKKGRNVAVLAVHYPMPRNWTIDDVLLIEEVAERTWETIERARAEEALRQAESKYRAELEQQVHDRTSELKSNQQLLKTTLNKLMKKNKEVEVLNHEIKTFNIVAARDYKETLQQLYTNLEYLISNDARHLSNAGKGNIRRAQSSIQKMNLLTDDINTYFRLYDLDVEILPVNANKVLEEVLKTYKTKFEQYNTTVQHTALPTLPSHPILLTQLLTSLLDNSIKYRNPLTSHFITINYSSIHEPNIIKPEKDYHYGILSLSDNGLGFSQEEADKIFDLLYQRNDKGTQKISGIGLATCKKIMTMHAGFIKAESKPGEGATFYCYFPLNENKE